MNIIMNERCRSWSRCAWTQAALTRNVRHFDKWWSSPYDHPVSRDSSKVLRTFYKSSLQMVKGKLFRLMFHLHISFPKSQCIEDHHPRLARYLADLITNRSISLRGKYNLSYIDIFSYQPTLWHMHNFLVD